MLDGLFPRLELLDEVFPQTRFTRELLRDVTLVGCQHLLESTGSLIEHLVRIGLNESQVFLMGKSYSTSESVLERLLSSDCHIEAGSRRVGHGRYNEEITREATSLWRHAEEGINPRTRRIVILDDGGYVHLQTPSHILRAANIVGVEQTTFGIAHNALIQTRKMSVVNVAESCAKRVYEAPLISDAVVQKIRRNVPLGGNTVCGVIGCGTIGLELAKKLIRDKVVVYVFDSSSHQMEKVPEKHWCESVKELVSRCDVIFGCVGDDVLRLRDLSTADSGVKVFASCSSGDVEFRNILMEKITWEEERGTGAFPTLAYSFTPNYRIRILRSGYPVNFDNSDESVPTGMIQLTRALLCAGVLQACRILSKKKQRFGSVKLDPDSQKRVVEAWLRITKTKGDVHDAGWFRDKSG